MEYVSTVLTAMTGWITTIINMFTSNDVLKVLLYIPIASFIIFIVINIIKSLFR